MFAFDWNEFLQAYSLELIAADDLFPELPAEVVDSKWLGYPGCSESDIFRAEERLGISLPRSLREFYRVTNGWRHLGYFVWEVLPIQRIGWFREIDPEFCAVASGVFDPSDIDDGDDPETTAVYSAICLGREGDASTLLADPNKLVNSDGAEWNVGVWASWHPGINWSGLDFQAFLRDELEQFRAMRDDKNG